jgi:hypothetical protein
VILKNENGSTEFDFKFYVTVEGGMDFRAMLMKRKVKQKKVVVKKIEWLEVSLGRSSGESLRRVSEESQESLYCSQYSCSMSSCLFDLSLTNI